MTIIKKFFAWKVSLDSIQLSASHQNLEFTETHPIKCIFGKMTCFSCSRPDALRHLFTADVVNSHLHLNDCDRKQINPEFVQKNQEKHESESKLPDSFYFWLPYLHEEMRSLKVSFTLVGSLTDSYSYYPASITPPSFYISGWCLT